MTSDWRPPNKDIDKIHIYCNFLPACHQAIAHNTDPFYPPIALLQAYRVSRMVHSLSIPVFAVLLWACFDKVMMKLNIVSLKTFYCENFIYKRLQEM